MKRVIGAIVVAVVVAGVALAVWRAGAPQDTASTATPAAASTAAPGPTAPSDSTAMADARDATRRILESTSASAADVATKATELGPDVDRLYRFVRDDIRYQTYAGVLRGARGTLASRAGNAWDKSELLASLLRRHGRDVRFARAHLTADRAASLVARMFEPQRPPAGAGARDSTPRADALVQRIDARWRTAQADLVAALDRSGIALGRTPPTTQDALIGEASDHVWVEYRDGDRWTALDPALGSAAGEAGAAAAETFAEIPDARRHRITFRVKVEERRGDALAQRDALVWSASSAELHAATVVVTHRISRSTAGWRARPIVMVGNQAYGAMSFTELGLAVPAGGSGPGAALIDDAHRQMQGAGRASELFGGSPAAAPPAVPALTTVTLDIEFTDPAGRTESVRRAFIDRLGPAARAAGGVGRAPLAPIALTNGLPVALGALYGCAITAGPLNARVIAERTAPALQAALSSDWQRPAGGAGPAKAARVALVANHISATLVAAAEAAHLLSQGLAPRIQADTAQPIFYEAGPRLAIADFDPVSAAFALD